MLVIAQMPHDGLVAEAESRGWLGAVGPTSGTGWTAMWCEGVQGPEDLVGITPFLAVTEDEREDATVLVVHDGTTETAHIEWPSADGDRSVSTTASALAGMFGVTEALEDLEQVLGADHDGPDELVDRLGTVLDLPEFEEGAPATATVAGRIPTPTARPGIAVAGPALAASVSVRGTEWTVVRAAEDRPGQALELAAALSSIVRRREAVIVLWHNDRLGGWQLWRRGALDAEWVWGSRWHILGTDPLDLEDEAVDAVERWVGAVDRSALRALLRRGGSPTGRLAEFVSLLGLPSLTLMALEEPDRFRALPDTELVARSSAPRAIMDDVLRAVDRPWPWFPPRRGIWAALDVAFFAIAALSVLATGLGWAVVISDGSDRRHLVFLSCLAGLNAAYLVLRVRAAWRRRRSADPHGTNDVDERPRRRA